MKAVKFFKILTLIISIAILLDCDRRVEDAGLASISIDIFLAAPDGINSITLNVSGPGMTTIPNSYSSPFPEKVTLNVPVGDDRTFELIAEKSFVTLRGEVVTDLPASKYTRKIAINMTLAGADLILPDIGNGRIVYIDDMQGNGWTERDNADLGLGRTFNPADIAFDNQGRRFILLMMLQMVVFIVWMIWTGQTWFLLVQPGLPDSGL